MLPTILGLSCCHFTGHFLDFTFTNITLIEPKWTHTTGNVTKLQCFIQFTEVNTQGLMQQSCDFCSFKQAVHANLSFPFQHDF